MIQRLNFVSSVTKVRTQVAKYIDIILVLPTRQNWLKCVFKNYNNLIFKYLTTNLLLSFSNNCVGTIFSNIKNLKIYTFDYQNYTQNNDLNSKCFNTCYSLKTNILYNDYCFFPKGTAKGNNGGTIKLNILLV